MLQRTLQILVGLGLFGVKLWIDQLQGQLEQKRRLRAIELRDTFTRLGPTFVKLGQGLSTKPDLCFPEFLEELSELQVKLSLSLFPCSLVPLGVFDTFGTTFRSGQDRTESHQNRWNTN